MKRQFKVNKVQTEMIFRRLSQVKYSRAVDVAVARLLRRMIETWPEMDPDSSETGKSGIIPVTEYRAIDFLGDEQRGVAMGLVALGEAGSAGDKLQIRREAEWLGIGILKWYDAHLFSEQLEEFDGEWADEKEFFGV